MGNGSRTYPVRVDVIRDLMDQKNISVAVLVSATGKDRRTIQNILRKKTQPFEDTLVRIGAMLGVKWRSLIEGYEGEPEPANEGGGVATKTTKTYLVDVREGMSNEQIVKNIMNKLSKDIDIADIVEFIILRRKNEN
jgi:transcriptional regulator with XRE-family HTH domain